VSSVVLTGITVIVPTYNEADFIEDCLSSMMDDLVTEVLVVDGGSSDGTREIVKGLTVRYPSLRLLDNPRRTTASAMNIGLETATGDVIVRLDAHSLYPPGYIARLTGVLQEHEADVTGGVWDAVPRKATVFGRAIAASLVNKWVMGNAGFRVGGGEVRAVDTVPFGCWRADTLRRAGGYNEDLARSQDYDLVQRLRSMGAKILLVPDVTIKYKARSGVWENVKYTFWNGYWVGHPVAAWGVKFSTRHLVPAGACLAGAALLGVCAVLASPWPLMLASPYGIVLLAAAVEARDRPAPVVALMPLVAAGTHVLYGLGTLWGLVKGVLARVAAGRAGTAAAKR
jgi:glycosyltransferase involved in cell wall biosynthesis